ncbi:MAG: hypothetical protein QF639_00985 [Rhodospirillales bacterium]|nr:hypothetical protein [Rhodospirillales bacterium]
MGDVAGLHATYRMVEAGAVQDALAGQGAIESAAARRYENLVAVDV